MSSNDSSRYKWVVLAACFVLQCSIPGVMSVFGVFLPQFLDYYGSSRGKTAIIGSMLSACLCIPGPVFSILANLFGCRKIAMLGGCFVTTGMLLSTLAPNVDVMIVTFGVISGLGIGMIYLPLIVMVGLWFEKKRAIAMGITTSGAGIGMIIMGLLSGILLEYYDWKNALVLLSGVTLHLVICGALLRPVEYRSEVNEIPPIYNDIQPLSAAGTYYDDTQPYCSLDTALHKVGVHKSSSKNSQHKFKTSEERIYQVKTNVPYSSLRQFSHEHKKNNAIYFSENDVNYKRRNHHGSPEAISALDIYYNSSYIEDMSAVSINKNINTKYSVDEKDTKKICCSAKDSYMSLRNMLGIHMLRSFSFIIILLSNALAQSGYVICICFVTDYGISLGLSPDRATSLVLAFGIGTTLGRLAGGVVTLIPKVGPVQATSASQILAGLCSLSIPLFCNDLISLSLFAALTGFFLAPICPLTAVMQVEFHGLENFTNSQGIMSLAKGIASLLGAPTAGLLQDITGSYTPPFYLTAAILTVSGVLMCFLQVCHKKHTKL